MKPQGTRASNLRGWLAVLLLGGMLTLNSAVVHAQSTVWAWGNNDFGQLGDGTTDTRFTPVQVNGPDGAGFLTGVSLIVGSNDPYMEFIANHTVALKEDGTVWAWGNNGFGQLGDGTGDMRLTPVQVKGPNGVGFLTDVVTVAAGLAHSVAVKTNGTVWAWGNNSGGQLGDNTTTNRTTPVQVVHSGDETGFLTHVVTVMAGLSYTVALRSDGTVWAWGSNGLGQLGDGTTTDRSAPVQVKGPGGIGVLTDVTALAAGWGHTLALKTNGTVWAWGDNHYGQLGDGATEGRSTPVQVKGPNSSGVLTDVVAVAAGVNHTAALKADGTVWAWGYNGSGQLGDGTITNRPTPVQVTGPGGTGSLTNVAAIAADGFYTLALKVNGTVWTWGDNESGQLGDNTAERRLTPIQVKGEGGTGFLDKVISIGAGGAHSLALCSEGAIQVNVSLESLACNAAVITFEFRPVGGGKTITQIRSGQLGVFTFTDIPEGEYNVAVKGDRWLRQVIPNVSTIGGNNVLNLRVFLKAGDANDDNIVDVDDLAILIESFDAGPADPNWRDGKADFTCDELVDVNDLALLIQNFDATGDD